MGVHRTARALDFCAVDLLLPSTSCCRRPPAAGRRDRMHGVQSQARLGRQTAGPGANALVFAQPLETSHACRAASPASPRKLKRQ